MQQKKIRFFEPVTRDDPLKLVVPKLRSLEKNCLSMILRLEIILSIVSYERKKYDFS